MPAFLHPLVVDDEAVNIGLMLLADVAVHTSRIVELLEGLGGEEEEED